MSLTFSMISRRRTSVMLAYIVVLISIFSRSVYCQRCGVSADVCGGRYAYCGAGNDYCAGGCRAISSDVGVADIVTDEFFNSIADRADPNCPGKGFYTRAAFLKAVNAYPQFGKAASVDVSKREIAALFAHMTDLTKDFCYTEEVDGPSRDYCDESNTRYPCARGKAYYGRGPVQLSYNFNYGAAGESIGFDGLKNPEIVATDSIVSFKTALWFWMNSSFHHLMTSGQGFGATNRAMFGPLPCHGENASTVDVRVGYYTYYCKQLLVDPGDNLRC